MLSSAPLDWLGWDIPNGPKEIRVLVLDSGKAPAQKYLAKHYPGEAASEFVAVLQKVVGGPEWVQLGNQFKPVQHAPGVWQVTGEKHRLLGFRDGARLILTHGFRKTTEVKQQKEIQKAAAYRAEFMSGS
jgi:hypothetical protein